MMRAGPLIGMAAAALVSGCASLAGLGLGIGGPAVFEILNDTQVRVERLYLRSPGDSSWRDDLLGQSYLPAGGWTEAPVDRAGGCARELRAVMSDGATYLARGIDVCKTSQFRLSQGERERPRVGGARTGAVVVGAAPQPMSRGLPICPGDPRCKRKK